MHASIDLPHDRVFLRAAIVIGFAAAVNAQCGIVHSSIKVRPNSLRPEIYAQSSYTLATARNEYESFIITCAGPLTVTSLNVQVDMAGVCVATHAIWNYNATQASDCNAAPGLWPDALIPTADVWYGETRNALPMTVPAAMSGSAWVDIFTPPSVPAGRYPGVVNVSYVCDDCVPAGSEAWQQLSFTVAVSSLTLPSVSPYPSHFGYTYSSSFFPPDYPVELMAQQYMDLGLMHRITLSDAFGASDAINTQSTPNFTAFDSQWGKYLRGTDLPFGLSGTRATAFMLPQPFFCNFANGSNSCAMQQVQYWKTVAAWINAQNIPAPFVVFDYSIDEPFAPWAWAELEARSAAVHSADANIAVLATTTIPWAQQANVPLSTVDLWVPIINAIEPRGGTGGDACMSPAGNTRPYYNNVSQPLLWWYQSCMSHGCDGGCYTNAWGSCEMGWPSYMIDHPAVANRAMGWATYLYNMYGELYWSLNYASAAGLNAFNSSWFAGGNGDGTLTYRGTPDMIGGQHEVPIASIRLKMIRDSQEDLMYMLAAEQVIGRPAVEAIVRNVLSKPFAFGYDDPSALLQARQALVEAATGAHVGAQRA